MSAILRKLPSRQGIPKCPTGITGLDEITEGGLPRGRPTLVCGSAGCGKTVLGLEFLVHGAIEFDEPGVFVAFEETEKELTDNVASMGFDLAALCARKKLFIDYVRVERNEMEETGEYDLEGLFVRLDSAIKAVGAKRIVLDTIESLFFAFANQNILRAELRRLFRWLKSRSITAVVTAERGGGTLTRHGIEEYVADCVIFLDHRVEDQSSIRRVRVVKYRGTMHGTSEYPFLIGRTGLSVLPLSSLKLDHSAPTQRVSTGISRLDTMLSGKGFFRGSSILVSGGAGTGKSSLAAHFVDAACRRGERAFYAASEQSVEEIIRNMRSIGIDLEQWIKRGLLKFHAERPGTFGLERHLVTIHGLIEDFDPRLAVIDPITNYAFLGTVSEVKSMLTRLVELFKSRNITGMFTSLTSGDSAPELSEVGVSSQMDVWILLRNLESNGERNRGLYVLKARGMAHSNQIREFILTNNGAQLVDVYVGPSGLLTGAARIQQSMRERADTAARQQEVERKKVLLNNKRDQFEAQIKRLRAEFELKQQALLRDIDLLEASKEQVAADRGHIARARHADLVSIDKGNGTRRGVAS